MGYTDLDKLAINTIRLLAVSAIPPCFFPPLSAPPSIAVEALSAQTMGAKSAESC
jgi:hypothetical protein